MAREGEGDDEARGLFELPGAVEAAHDGRGGGDVADEPGDPAALDVVGRWALDYGDELLDAQAQAQAAAQAQGAEES